MKTIAVIALLLMTTVIFGEESNDKLIGWWKVDEEYVKTIIEEMKKDMDEKGKSSLRFFLPRLKKMVEKQTLIIDEKNINSVYGDRERSTPYELTKVEGNEYTLKVGSREQVFVLVDNRLVSKAELNGKRPPMYMRKLSAAEVVKVKAAIAATKVPPPASAPADKRIAFLLYKASLVQQKELLKTQPDLLKLVHPSRKEMALSLAIGSDKTELAKLLIEAGTDVNQKNSRGDNMLFACISSRKVNREIFDLLVKSGLDVKAVNDRKETLLIKAADGGGDVEFIKHLISLGIDLNQKGTFGDTALSAALEKGKKDIVALLIEKGADITTLAESIDTFVRKGKLEALKLLADNKVYGDKYGVTAIMRVVDSNQAKIKAIVPQVLEIFKDTINFKDYKDCNALFYTKDLATIKLLVAAGIDCQQKNKFGDSLLHCNSGSSIEVLKYYIEEQKLPVDALNDRKNTPLMLAIAGHEDTKVAEYLIAKGADVNHVGFSQGTPLSWSVKGKGAKGKIEMLIAKGVDLNKSPLEVIKWSIFENNQEILKLLVKKGMSIKTDPKQHYTPFWYAIFSDKLEMAKLLIELGADPNVKNAAGKTALDIAKEFKKPEFIKLLSK